jgi:hypothetical protein
MMLGVNKDVEAILPLIPLGSIGVEIGVGKGDTSARFLTRAAWMHLVDPWSLQVYADEKEFGGLAGYIEHYAGFLGTRDPAVIQQKFDEQYGAVSKRFIGKNVTIHRMRSRDFFSDFMDKVDWVYVDGSHTAKGVYDDLEGAARGADVIFGDDYNAGNHDVKYAVQVFSDNNGYGNVPEWKLDFHGHQQYRFTRKA